MNLARKVHARLLETLAIQDDQVAQDSPPISFSLEDMIGVAFLHNNALVIRVTIANYDVAHVLVDSGSSVKILFQEAFSHMQLERAQLEDITTPLFNFIGYAVSPNGQITFPLTLGDGLTTKTIMAQFLVVDALSTYNGILGHPCLISFLEVASPLHKKLKFTVGSLTGEVHGD